MLLGCKSSGIFFLIVNSFELAWQSGIWVFKITYKTDAINEESPQIFICPDAAEFCMHKAFHYTVDLSLHCIVHLSHRIVEH